MCTGKGAKELAVNIEDFVIDIYYHFRRSAKGKAQSIKHVSTRWLSLGKCLERTLKQWDSLESYFLSYFDLQDDPEADGKTNQETRLEKAFTTPLTKLHAMFVQSVMPVFDSFNAFLQSEEPLIHMLLQSTIRLYRSLLTRFIRPQVISS